MLTSENLEAFFQDYKTLVIVSLIMVRKVNVMCEQIVS
jgi:hypothetical protein